jgi:hypothetical protein
MGVKSSTESFTNQSFVSGRNPKITTVRPKTGSVTSITKKANKVEKYKLIQRMLKN